MLINIEYLKNVIYFFKLINEIRMSEFHIESNSLFFWTINSFGFKYPTVCFLVLKLKKFNKNIIYKKIVFWSYEI